MNRDIDYAIGRYVIMHVSDNGLSRLEGHTTYRTWAGAIRGVENYLREVNGHKRVTLLKIERDFWLHPNPKMMTNQLQDKPS